MKNTFFLAVASLLFSVAVSAQSTVDSIAAKYKLLPMPAPLTIEKTFPVLGTYTLAGTGQAADAVADAASAVAVASVVVTLDSVNKGMVWVEGLPEGRIKAYLKKSPATYRILAQKSESGQSVPEGTLILDTATQTLNVALGAPFNETDPAAIFTFNNSTPDDNTVEIKAKSKNAKTKAKVTFYTASKVVVTPPVDTQVQDEDQMRQNDQQATEQKEGEVKQETKEGQNG